MEINGSLIPSRNMEDFGDETQINCIDKGSFKKAQQRLCSLVESYEEKFEQA